MIPSDDTAKSEALEQVVGRFERAWQCGGNPFIEEYLEHPAVERTVLLRELAHIDLEYRWKAGRPVRVEEYLQRFPELAGEAAEVIELIAAEFGFRRRREPELNIDEYSKRFPHLDRELIDRLRREVKESTRAQVESPTFQLERRRRGAEGISNPSNPTFLDSATASDDREHWPQIPGYDIGGVLGKGGMGVVWKATDVKLNRQVAIKMIRDGVCEDEEERTRFLMEAEAVAGLRHPNIVQLYEVGQYRGLPYFTLEYFPEGSLSDRLQQGPLQPAAAARLVEQLADGVDFAHAAGIVHRDLKPANILLSVVRCPSSVAEVDCLRPPATDHEPRTDPKITDFGLAKRVNLGSGLTATGALIGTPCYMPPEQARGDGKHVGPETDVYALGAILYECLTGRPPFRGPSPAETLHQVLADEPVRPRRLQPKVPRDLETICLKCLQKEPKKRYTSAANLSADLRRFLEGKPIQARPTPLWERTLLWARRRPAWAALAGLGLLLLLSLSLATALLTAAFQRERKAKDDAIQARVTAQDERAAAIEARRLAELKEKEATRQARTAAETARFLTDMFSTSDPFGLESIGFRSSRQKGADVTAREILDRGLGRVKDLQDPIVRAAMLDTLGNVSRSLGLYDRADPLLTEALKIRLGILEETHADTATTLHHLGWLRQEQGKFAEAERLYRRALAVRRKLFGKDDPQTAATMFNLGWLLAHQYDRPTPARLEEAERLFQEVVKIRRERLGRKHRQVGFALTALAVVRMARGEPLQKGLPLLTEAYAILEGAEGADQAGGCLVNYFFAVIERKAGHYAKAERLYRKVLDKSCALLGEEHPLNILLLGDLAGLLRQNKKPAEAEKTIRRALKLGRNSPLRWHPAAIEAYVELGDIERKRGNTKEAEKLYREALEIATRTHKADRLQTVLTRLVGLLREQNRGAEADKLLRAVSKK